MKTSSKKIAKNGSITIPKQMRTEAGYFSGNAVDLEMTDNGIRITKHVANCQFCGSVNNIHTVDGITICADCAHKLHEAVMADD